MYVSKFPTENGNHGNPVSKKRNGMVALPDELIPTYCDSFGFVDLTIEGETVTAVTRNEDAYQAYIDSIPEPEPQPEPMTQAEIEETLLDQEYRLLLLEYGLEEEETI